VLGGGGKSTISVRRGVEPKVKDHLCTHPCMPTHLTIVFYAIAGDDPVCGVQAVSEKHQDVQILCQHIGPLHKGGVFMCACLLLKNNDGVPNVM